MYTVFSFAAAFLFSACNYFAVSLKSRYKFALRMHISFSETSAFQVSRSIYNESLDLVLVFCHSLGLGTLKNIKISDKLLFLILF